MGRSHVREAGPDDAVDGVPAGLVVEPASVDELSGVLQVAHAEGVSVCPRGSGSRLGLGNPPRTCDLVVSTARLARLVEHAAGDLVVRAEAGLPLDALQRRLAEAGQRLALDPAPGGTLGGVVATNASGPLRHRYGTVRDLVIGITVVLSDGTVARAGGKVVKNVAGYDLGKLLCGSFGTLAVIAELTFRLHPLPATRRAAVLRVETPAVGAAVAELLRAPLTPSAVELAFGEEERALAVLFEGGAPGCEAQASAAAALLAAHGPACVLDAEAAAALWARLRPAPWSARPLGLKLTAPPAALDRLVAAVREVDARAALRAHAGSGVLLAGLSLSEADAQAEAVRRLRACIPDGDGAVVVTSAPGELRRSVDAFGPVATSLPLMRRVKQQFDPPGLLNPGRFLHGLD